MKEGAKYDLAASDSRIKVVSPSWLEACGRSGTRVNEDSYKVGSTELDMGANTLSTGNKPGYRQILHSLLEERKISSCLFEYHQFYLLGFENDPDIKALLGKVIRSGGGTIHWDISNDVTLLIVHDTCHEALRYAGIQNQRKSYIFWYYY